MDSFAKKLLNWFEHHGRKNLPWQQTPSPYRVWVSEIMLQQTQVSTVIPYFKNFIDRFPSINDLASANEDEVLHLWTGLGYYARARNLRKAAQVIRDQFDGQFPQELTQVIALPGIGPSTAGAILSLSQNQCHPILDGNVKRVLCRYHAIEGWAGKAAIEKELWQLAHQHTPNSQNAAYTQAIMDLGATLCTRRQPNCPTCPFVSDCAAHAQQRQHELPTPKPKKQIPTRTTLMLLLCCEGEVFLQKRPPVGIWGGLWSFPEIEVGNDDEKNIRHWAKKHLSSDIHISQHLPQIRHTFSHFHLEIKPVIAKSNIRPRLIQDSPEHCWHTIDKLPQLGLASPIKALLLHLQQRHKN